MIKVGTDFSGIGSPESALKRLGIPHDLIFACDIDKYARKSYNAIHPNADIIYEDITTRDFDEVPQLDLYIAGFPCQSFSIAGKKEGFNDVRGTLFYNVAEFIEYNQPECFILENVKGLLSHDKGRTFQTIIDLLSNAGGTVNGQLSLNTYDDGLGYHIYHKVLNTKDYGIPQNRERVFIIGFRDYREFRFPKPIPLELRLKDILQDNPKSKYLVTKHSYLNLLKNQKFNNYKTINVNTEWVDCITARCNKLSNDNNFVEVDDKYYLSDKMIEGFTLKNGKNGIYGDLNKGGERGLVFSEKSEYINCLTATDYKQPKQIAVESQTKKIRRLTPLECWRLQGFTDEEFYRAEAEVSDTQLYKQAGNSITVNVIAEILKKIYL